MGFCKFQQSYARDTCQKKVVFSSRSQSRGHQHVNITANNVRLCSETHSKIIVFLCSTTVCQTITTILVTFVETLVTLLPLQFSFTLPIGKTVRDRALETYTEATSTHGKKESESVENWNRRNDMKNPASTLSVDHMLVSALRDSGPSGCEGDLSNMSWVFCREFSFTFPWILGLLIQTNQTLFKYKNLFKPYPANIPKSTSAALLSSSVVWAAWN